MPVPQSGPSILTRMWAKALPARAPITAGLRMRAWWRACRPPFFIVDLIPVAIGLALALNGVGNLPRVQPDSQLWLRLMLVLFGCFCIHTVANIANDLFDFILDVDGEDTIGGTRVIQDGLISPRAITVAMGLLAMGGFASAMALLSLSGQWWLIWLLVFALFSAIYYVAPPIRYGHRGYGELFVALNMGLVMVCGTHSVLASGFAVQSLAFGLPVGLMVAGILYFQSLPEIETDLAGHKFTLAVRIGKVRSEFLFRLWWPAVWVLLMNLYMCGLAGWPVFFSLLSVPLYKRACNHVRASLQTDTPQGWLGLDAHGHLVRKLYLLNGLALLAGAIWT